MQASPSAACSPRFLSRRLFLDRDQAESLLSGASHRCAALTARSRPLSYSMIDASRACSNATAIFLPGAVVAVQASSSALLRGCSLHGARLSPYRPSRCSSGGASSVAWRHQHTHVLFIGWFSG